MAANEFNLEELEMLFGTEEQVSPPDENKKESPTEQSPVDKNEMTKNMSERIKAVKRETQEETAKAMGFTTYEEMIKSKENDLIKSKGYNPEELSPLVDELVNKKIAADPRMKELESFKKERVADYAKKQLAQISELTNGEITTLKDVPEDVIERWQKTGDLKGSFLALKGEEYIMRARKQKDIESTKGGTSHLQQLDGGSTPKDTQMRPLTAQEKSIWKKMFPAMSDEELDKKTTPIQ